VYFLTQYVWLTFFKCAGDIVVHAVDIFGHTVDSVQCPVDIVMRAVDTVECTVDNVGHAVAVVLYCIHTFI